MDRRHEKAIRRKILTGALLIIIGGILLALLNAWARNLLPSFPG